MERFRGVIDRSALIAICCIVGLLVLGSFYSSNFLSLFYLKQQLQISAFLGVIALGAMMVILLGHIDLSVPWVVTMGGMMSTAAAEWGANGLMALPFALLCGMLVGLVNGFGVAFLRIPSMIFTLGVNAVVQGLMVLHTGGAAPLDRATSLMHELAVGRVLFGIPNAALVWLAIASLLAVLLGMTPVGRYFFAVGNQERAAYLSGINTRFVLILAFVIAGMCSALAGVPARRIFAQSLSGDGRSLSSSSGSWRGARRHERVRRPRHGSRDRRRDNADHCPAQHAVGHANARSGPASDLW